MRDVTIFSEAVAAVTAKASARTPLERAIEREIAWRSRPEWAIRQEMDRAVERRLRKVRR